MTPRSGHRGHATGARPRAAAADEAALRAALVRWQAPGRRVVSLETALPPPTAN